jgi:hypothetical protein
MSLDKVIEECSGVLDAKKNSISSLLSVFGKLVPNVDSTSNTDYGSTYVKECQFAIVYKYISDENKSDRLTFKHESNVNAKATDFVNGLDKYLRTICRSLIAAKDINAQRQDIAYATSLSDELKMIRSKSHHSLAQSLSTKINRYDTNKALITAVYDALQRGVPLSELGELFAQTYSMQGNSSKYGGVMPRYKEYMDRQKAINNARK